MWTLNESTLQQTALDWAGNFVDVQQSERVTNTPWAKTYKVTHSKGQAFLKILPPIHTRSATSIPLLSGQFPYAIPATIAADSDKGLILLADHGGKDLRRHLSESERINMLETYASIQSESVSNSKLFTTTPTLELVPLVDHLISFLTPGGTLTEVDGAKVNADYFLSASRSQGYASHIAKRAEMLRECIANHGALPHTINHCDLRPSNAAKDKHGNTILYDWDEAVIAPAGLSLHAMFSGCADIFYILGPQPGFKDPETLRQPKRELAAYISRLVEKGYADTTSLERSLSATALAGMIHYIIGFSRFPKDSDSYKRTIRANLSRRLSNLLDVCDYLCICEGDNVDGFAEDYRRHHRSWRAERMLSHYLRAKPHDPKAFFALGKTLSHRGKHKRAVEAYREGLEISPQVAEPHFEAGRAYTQLGDYDRAIRHLRRSVSLQADTSAEKYLDEVYDLQRSYNDAKRSGFVPSVTFSDAERQKGKAATEKTDLCRRLFRRYGTLLLKNVFDIDVLDQCRSAFFDRYEVYVADKRHEDALRIGDKRFQITVDIEPPFNSQRLYANGMILPLMHSLLGDKYVLGCFTSIMSLPGSKEQRLHKDHRHLFYDGIDMAAIPSFAITMMVPLIDLNEQVGTTRVKKGSHRLTTGESKKQPYQSPFPKKGDCYLMDYRLSHHGQANRSNTPRPILSIVYQRPWFRDYINFKNQPHLRISQEQFDALPKELKPLLAWTNEPGPR